MRTGGSPGILAVVTLATFAIAPARSADLYVAPTGNDSWSGRRAAPNRSRKDGPFRTIERSLVAARRLLQEGPVTIWLRGGVYELRESVSLSAADSGSPGHELAVRAYRGEHAILRGGVAIPKWGPVTDAAVLDRLTKEARNHVVCADLKALGITNYGKLTPRGFGRPVTPAALELFFRDRPMTLARWPNEDWAHIKATPAGQQGGTFTFEGGQPERWKDPSDVWVHGYWTYDWADTYERVAKLDPTTRTVTTEPPHGVYGYSPGKRFYFLNVLEELDHPGEWYLDRATGKLYFWPPSFVRPGDAVVSLLDQPLLRIADVRYLTVSDITFECSRASAIEMTGGEQNLITHCEFRNLGTSAISIVGGRRHTIADCHIHDIGEGGIHVDGGDRKTLTPARHLVLRNHIHDYSRWCFTYRPAVGLNGVGNIVANNAIHDAPHNAILVGGNDHLIELNDIARVCLQTGDAGAIYMGRNMTMRGTVIRWNYFHDVTRTIGGNEGFVDVMSVYLDDCFCGTTVFGNVFVRAGRAAMIGGGRDNRIENNIFVDCRPAVHVDSRGIGWAKFWFDGRDPFIMNGLREVNFDKPPYSERYPQLVNLLNDQPGLAKGNVIARNVSLGGKWIELFDGLDEKIVQMDRNFTSGDPGFVDAAALDFRLKPNSPLEALGFEPIPLERIGLPEAVPTPWAPVPPMPTLPPKPTAPASRMRIWQSLRFGMFVHWGIYSVGGVEASWPLFQGQFRREEYEGWAQQFRPASFDARQLVRLAKRAGMKYLVITTKHHDGFAMFDTRLSDYSIMHGPLKRDLVGEVVRACRAEGLKVGFYFSLCDWHDARYPSWPIAGAWPFGPIRPDPERWAQFLAFLHGQVKELLTNYGPVDILWFDGGWEHTPDEWQSDALMDTIRKLQPGIIVNDRLPGHGDYATPEQTIPQGGLRRPWETCMTINNTWGYNPSDKAFKSARDLIRNLCRIAGGGGNFLLNVGPRPDGSIQPEFVERLQAIGDWLRIHGEAIYGTQAGPADLYPSGAVTRKGTTLYIHVSERPAGPILLNRSLMEIASARLLSDGKPVKYQRTDDGIALLLEPGRFDPNVTVIALEVPALAALGGPSRPDAQGVFVLRASDADVHGAQLTYQPQYDDLGVWMTPSDWAEWTIHVPETREYEVVLSAGVPPSQEGSVIELRIGQQAVRAVTKPTTGWTDYRPLRMGRITLQPGTSRVALRCLRLAAQAVLNVREIRIIPAKATTSEP